MIELSPSADEQVLTGYCEQVEALGKQLAAAIDAIAHHQLRDLEHSIIEQQHSLSKLLLTAELIERTGQSPPKLKTHERLRTSVQALVRLNERYSALLEHTSRSLHMLQAMDPRFALTTSRSGAELSLAENIGREFATQTALSWHV